MSVRYTGDAPTNELAFFVGLLSPELAGAQPAPPPSAAGRRCAAAASTPHNPGRRWHPSWAAATIGASGVAAGQVPPVPVCVLLNVSDEPDDLRIEKETGDRSALSA